jgi:hypothetical protein
VVAMEQKSWSLKEKNQLVFRLISLLIIFFGVRGVYNKSLFSIYFTTWSNALVFFTLIWLVIGQIYNIKMPPDWFKAGVTLFITIVGLFALSSQLVPIPKMPHVSVFLWWSALDICHKVAPVIMILDYLIFTKRFQLKKIYALYWTGFFVFYYIFILVHAQFNRKWPYPFLDLDKNGLKKQIIIDICLFAILYGISLCITVLDGKIKKISKKE